MAQNGPFPNRTLGGPLVLADQGSFFIGGRTARTEGHTTVPPADFLKAGDITVDQMYVQYMIPSVVSGPPVIMMHGFNHTGVTFETTPDGREGWATYFARKGYPVYVVDQPGRGRSGFDPTAFNQAKTTGDARNQPPIPLYPTKDAWVGFRFGKEYPNAHLGQQFPVSAIADYAKQLVPNMENTLKQGWDTAAIDLAALLQRVGPAVVVVHSQAGGMGLGATKLQADKTLALVNVEGNCVPMSTEDIENVFSKVPFLAVWGDYSVGAYGPVGDARRNGCTASVEAIRKQRGRADFVLLADHQMPGHSHMMMMDKGNLNIADLIIQWLKDNRIGEGRAR